MVDEPDISYTFGVSIGVIVGAVEPIYIWLPVLIAGIFLHKTFARWINDMA